LWKLADFGFASEGNSSTLRTSYDAKGTSGYRVPELLIDGKPGYNNKVDIWSMGCILYELAVGRRAFYNDFATIKYRISKPDISVYLDNSFGEQCKETVTRNITRILRIDPCS
jgi:serine/threonine protein kinase